MNENKLERAAFNELLFNYAMIPVKGHFHPTLADLSYDTNAMINMFKQGAFWQEDQSPWISAKETPPMDKPLLFKYGDGGIDDMELGYYTGLHYLNKNGQEVDMHVVEWMKI